MSYSQQEADLITELESLRAQVETLQRDKAETIRICDATCDSYAAENQQFADELSALKEQNAVLTLDAERYRWLRDRNDSGDQQWFVYAANGPSLDKDIDAAISAQEPK